jgi:hypothetical protein
MDITTLIISKLLKEDNNSNIQTYKEGDRDSPYIEAEFYIKNVSDTTFIIYPEGSKSYIKYRYNGRVLKNEMMFHLKDYNMYPNEIILKPDENIRFLLYGYIINIGTLLEVEFIKMNDRRNALIKILPTLKFIYQDQNGTTIESNEILQVVINPDY